ncbi:MAG: YceI family protein [Bacteroidia bacterium]
MKTWMLFMLLGLTFQAEAQKLITRTGTANFYSKATMEDISADNKQVTMLINTATQAIAVKVPIRSFEFEKALMEEHFNENYLESEKFPEATFTGKISESTPVDWKKDGTYEVTVEGKLTIHGVSKMITEKATITVKGETVSVSSKFRVKLADYGIKNDKMESIAEEIDIQLKGELKAL